MASDRVENQGSFEAVPGETERHGLSVPLPAAITKAERVGLLDMLVVHAEETLGASAKRPQRADALAAWLLSAWAREREERT